jgi:CubicO group peptidase (beta-lactamase class C family)
LTPKTVTDAVRERSAGRWWSGTDMGLRWGTGFMLDSSPLRAMLGPRSFGHDGAGGQMAFGDDEFGIGFGYVTSRMGGPDDERANALVAAVRRCLAG